jgi:outer membrane receptor protein involved in Fe transport
VPAAQYGSGALNSPAGQYNFLQGGNPNLSPETADTDTIGVVFTPRFIEGLTLSVDWFKIEIVDTISTFLPSSSVTACYTQNDAAACSRINRNPLGQLWVGEGHVVATNINIGGLKTAGIDVNFNYRFDVGDIGRLSFALQGTYLDYLTTDEGPGIEPLECKGFYGSTSRDCGTPNPEWRHRFRVAWETPWDLELSLTWRHYGEVSLFGNTNPNRLDAVFDAQNYLDIAGNWTLNEHARFRAGVNNFTDEEPPISASVGTTGNGNTYPQTYDSLGRFIFAGVTVDF